MSGARAPRHDSAHLHVSGRALYATTSRCRRTLHAAFGMSSIAHGRINASSIWQPVLATPGVVAVALRAMCRARTITAAPCTTIRSSPTAWCSTPGSRCSPWPRATYGAARKAARRARSNTSRCRRSWTSARRSPPELRAADRARCVRASPREMLARAAPLRGTLDHRRPGSFLSRRTDRDRLPQEDGGMLVHSSTQHPTEVQQIVAHALGRHAHDVTCSAGAWAAASAARKPSRADRRRRGGAGAQDRRPVKLRLDRDADMLMTGKRHDFLADYDVGFDDARAA
jgi:xanthine dehydrogenase large subunit